MDEDKLRQDAARAVRAKSLIENEFLTEAFTALETRYIDAWRTTNALDDKGREKLFIAVNVVGKVREHLQNVISNGVLAKKELEDLARLNEPKKRFGIV